jgi:hypothetical protein
MRSFTSSQGKLRRQIQLDQYAWRNRRVPTESEARLWQLLGGRSDEWVVFHDFVDDWNGSGRATPAVFQSGRLVLPSSDPSQLPLVLPLRTEIDTTGPPASYEMLDQLPLFLTHRLPALRRGDTDGDGRADLVAALGDRLAIYPATEDGRYTATHPRQFRFPSSADPRDETRRQFIQLADLTVLDVVDRDVAPTVGAYQGRRRMTLTFPALDRARRVLWLVTGGEKVEMLARLRAGDRSIPAGRVGQDRALVLADRAAAGGTRPS